MGYGACGLVGQKKLNDSFFAVINADDFYGAETFNLLEKALSKMNSGADGPQLISMIGFRLSETLSEHGSVSRGICQSQMDCFNLLRNGPGLVVSQFPD